MIAITPVRIVSPADARAIRLGTIDPEVEVMLADALDQVGDL